MAIIRVIKGFRFHYPPVVARPQDPARDPSTGLRSDYDQPGDTHPRRARPDREFTTGPVTAAHPHGEPREYEIADDDPLLLHPWIKEDFADGHIESPAQAKVRKDVEAAARPGETPAQTRARLDAEAVARGGETAAQTQARLDAEAVAARRGARPGETPAQTKARLDAEAPAARPVPANETAAQTQAREQTEAQARAAAADATARAANPK